MVGAKGSKIVVTTREAKVASVMGNISPYLLKGLEENQSWNLFSKIAFREGLENVHPNIIEIGKEIAKMCKGVPLIVKTLGTMLQFKSEERHWLSIKNNENLLSLGDGNDNVLPVLKLSYDNLPTHLRQCFGYCALFPKDYEIEKELVVQLWMAQGYIQPSNENERLEDVGDQYFKELLSRSLLEEVQKDAFDNILSCKMHDLIHDLAQSIIGSDILILRKGEMNIPEKVHHVSFYEPFYPMVETLKTKPIRTFLSLHQDVHSIKNSFIPSFKYLRVLSLHRLFLHKVPKYLGKLSHLRYLDLSFNYLKALPNSITKLKNLQTLRVMNCWNLKRFPKFTRELINLRHLRNEGCENLTQMPYGIGQLTLLQSLSLFVVGTGQAGDHKIGGLSELKGLNQLTGVLRISNLENVRDVVPVSRGEILKGKQYLRTLTLEWKGWRAGKWDENGELVVMEGLQPHRNLKELFIEGYGGRWFPSWMMNDGLGSLLPNLIKIEIKECSRCQILPPFSQLPSLQSLKLFYMEEVEEMKEDSSATLFFPSLQFLKLSWMTQLKGLWRTELGSEQGLSFPCLSELDINGCSNLTSIHLSSSPSLSTITIWDCDELISLQLHSSPSLSTITISYCDKLTSLQLHSSSSLSLSLFTLEIQHCDNLTSLELPSSPSLSQLDTKGCFNLTSIQLSSSPSLSNITISDCYKLISLQLHSSSSLSLSTLQIRHCHNLTYLELPSSPRLSHLDIQDCLNLTSVEIHSSPCLYQLKISCCPCLTSLKVVSLPCLECLYLERVREEVLQQIMFVSASSSLKSLSLGNIHDTTCISLLEQLLQHVSTLQTLDMWHCPELMASLPQEMPSLKTLQMLEIGYCSRLATLPHWIGILTSLTELHIYGWPELTSLPEEIHSLKTLQMLKIGDCSALATLPHSIGSLTSLKELRISDCPELTSLPEEMRSLKNLQMLRIDNCPHLEERCQKETGADWPKISHIPNIMIR